MIGKIGLLVINNIHISGQHGLIIKKGFQNINLTSGVLYSATYLPDVAESQGWDVCLTIDSLIQKAGYVKPIKAYLRDQLEVQRYECSKECLLYRDV
jgi:AMMECR1 domain-containing protein